MLDTNLKVLVLLGCLYVAVRHYGRSLLTGLFTERYEVAVPSHADAVASLERVKVRLMATGTTLEQAKSLCDPIAAKLTKDGP